MTYANFKGNLKKVNIKPKGVKEIVIEINGDELDGQLEALSGMVDIKVNVELDAEHIAYKRKTNAITNRPIVDYKITETGVIEVKQPEQLELEGMPENKPQIIEEEHVIEKNIIDEFVKSGLAPTYEHYHGSLLDILYRRIGGESYQVLATEYEINKYVLIEQIKGYRMEIAPMAEAWNKWRIENEANS